jgi:hypothetical protein
MGSTYTGKDRRREPRLGLRCPIYFRLLDRKEEGHSVTVDVSARGARFRTVSWRSLGRGDRLEVKLTVPSAPTIAGAGGIDLVGRGRIVRIEPGPAAPRLAAGGIAVEFDSPLNLSSIL